MMRCAPLTRSSPVSLHRADLAAGDASRRQQDRRHGGRRDPFGRRHGRLWRGSFPTSQPHSRPSAAAGENAPRQDIPLDWVRGVERLHRLSQLRAAVETTGTVSAIAAKKNGPQLSRCPSATRTVRLGGHVQSGTRRVAQKIRGNHSLRKQNPHQRASYWLG